MKNIHERINQRSAMGGINIFKSALDWPFKEDEGYQPIMCRKWVSRLSKTHRKCRFGCR